jgi:hypothetical protein
MKSNMELAGDGKIRISGEYFGAEDMPNKTLPCQEEARAKSCGNSGNDQKRKTRTVTSLPQRLYPFDADQTLLNNENHLVQCHH